MGAGLSSAPHPQAGQLPHHPSPPATAVSQQEQRSTQNPLIDQRPLAAYGGAEGRMAHGALQLLLHGKPRVEHPSNAWKQSSVPCNLVLERGASMLGRKIVVTKVKEREERN